MFSGINGETLNVAMLAGARLQKGRQKQHFFLKKAKCLWMKEERGEKSQEHRRDGEKRASKDVMGGECPAKENGNSCPLQQPLQSCLYQLL